MGGFEITGWHARPDQGALSRLGGQRSQRCDCALSPDRGDRRHGRSRAPELKKERNDAIQRQSRADHRGGKRDRPRHLATLSHGKAVSSSWSIITRDGWMQLLTLSTKLAVARTGGCVMLSIRHRSTPSWPV